MEKGKKGSLLKVVSNVKTSLRIARGANPCKRSLERRSPRESSAKKGKEPRKEYAAERGRFTYEVEAEEIERRYRGVENAERG